MKILKTGLLVLLLLFTISGSAQTPSKINNNWALGHSTSGYQGMLLDFNNPGPPVFSSCAMDATEGCAAVSDLSGQLLFYSNGNVVWDRQHNPMPNGSDLLGNGYTSTLHKGSAAQGVVIVPFQVNKYFIFETEPTYPPEELEKGYLRYSIVDMTLNNGLGDVVTGAKNIILDSFIGEGAVAVKGEGCYTWLVVQAKNGNFKAFKIETTGHIALPVISSSNISFAAYTINASPDGTMLANYHDLYTFDKSTGSIGNIMTFLRQGYVYGSCFSPDGSKLYHAPITVGGALFIEQYDLSLLPNTSAVRNSGVLLPSGRVYELREGPDKKLYIMSGDTRSLHVIEQPNLPGAACSLVLNAIPVAANYGMILNIGTPVPDLPYNSIKFVTHDTVVCSGGPFRLSGPPGFQQYAWSNGEQTRDIQVTVSGVYHLVSSNDCEVQIDSLRVRFEDLQLHLGNDTFLCEGETLMLQPGDMPDGAIYEWSDNSTAETLKVTTPGVYRLTVTRGPCRVTDDIRVEMDDCHCVVFVPNSFTPNGDNMNDHFGPIVHCRVTGYSFRIFNRWGQCVFYTVDPDKHWDGMYQSRPCDVGVYFYYLKYTQKILGEEVIKKGEAHLLR